MTFYMPDNQYGNFSDKALRGELSKTGKKIPESFKNTNMAKIYNTAQLAALSDEEYRAYVSEIFEEERRLNEQATTFNEGKRQGRVEGEKNKAIEIARNGLRKGLSVDDVAEITGLSIEEVVSLKENLK